MKQLYITKVQIEKVRHLRDICIPLSKDKMKHLILTGRNGSGKTSVLEALADNLQKLEIESDDDVYQDSYKPDFLSEYLELENESQSQKKDISKEKTEKAQKRIFAYIEAMKVIGKKENWQTVLQAIQNVEKASDMEVRVQFNCEEKFWEEEFGQNKLLFAYYKAERVFQPEIPKHVEKVELREVYSIEEMPKTEFVKYLLDLKMTEALAVAKKDKEKVDRIQQWFQKLENLLKEIFEDTELKLIFDEEKFQFYIQETGHETFDFSTLSSGYSAVMDIIADMMIRMEKITDKSFRFMLPGIVLIDEIETHLHLELQKKILRILTELFPNIQFIVSTHSPFVLNSLENAVIYDLENHTLVENGLANVPYDGIVEGYFQADVLSQVLKEKYIRYKELVKKKKLSDEDFEEVARLEMFLDEIPDYLALGITTEYQRLKLEFQSRENLEW